MTTADCAGVKADEHTLHEDDVCHVPGKLANLLLRAGSDQQHDTIAAACELLGRGLGADLVALQARDGDYTHAISHWETSGRSRLTNSSLRVLDQALYEAPILTQLNRQVVLDLSDQPAEPRRSHHLTLQDHDPQVIFCPVPDQEETAGHLALVAAPGTTWDAQVLQIAGVAASLMGNFMSRVRAETSARRHLELSHFLRLATQSLYSINHGDDVAAVRDALESLGNLVSAGSVALWNLDGKGTATRDYRWTAPGANVPEPHSETMTGHEHAAIAGITAMREPFILGKTTLPGFNSLLAERASIATPSWLLVPGILAGSPRVVLVLSRTTTQPWEDFEVDALGAFADLIPLLRDRLETESQIAAMFHDAPMGITVRSEDGALIDCNDAFLNFLGLEHEQTLLGTCEELLDHRELTATMRQVFAHPHPTTNGMEIPFRHARGHTVWGRLSTGEIKTQNSTMQVTHVEDVTAERQTLQVIRRRAAFDEVTGLANRHELMDLVGAHLGLNDNSPTGDIFHHPNHSPCAAILLDLDGFKEINDHRGHAVGDEILNAVGRRLLANIRPGDTAGRYGGDEFVVVLSGPLTELTARQRASQLAASFQEPFDCQDGTRMLVGASFGVAVAEPGDTVSELLSRADQEMYRNKTGAKTRVRRPSSGRRR